MFYYDVGVFQCPVKGSPYPLNKNICIIIIIIYIGYSECSLTNKQYSNKIFT